MIKYFNVWVLSSLALYYLGPIPWTGQSNARVFVIVLSSLIMFNVGAFLGMRSRRRLWQYSRLALLEKTTLVYVLLLIYGIFFTLHLQIVSGRFLFAPSSWSLDYGSVYSSYIDTVTSRDSNSVGLNILLVMKACIFPLIIYSFFKYFRENRVVLVAVVFFFVGSSFMRGTDKDSFDVVLLILVASYHYGSIKKVVAGGLVVAPVLILMFVERKLGRFSGVLPSCLPESYVCFDYSSNWAESFGPAFEMGRVMLVNYLTQGYEGLHLATTTKFDFNFGLGHLVPLKSAVCSIFGTGCELVDYRAKLTEIGWNTNYRWSSMYTSLANDLHWVFVPVYFLLVGRVFGIADREWRRFRSPAALMTIFLVTLMFLYSSANMQIAVTMDWVFATLLFLYLPLVFSLLPSKNTTPLLVAADVSSPMR